MENKEIENNFNYHKPNEEMIRRMTFIRNVCKNLAFVIQSEVPDGREQALALTKLEETMMWANAGITRHGRD